MVRSRSLWFRLSLAVAVTAALVSQPAGKRPLAHSDYDSWKAIVGQRLSADGRYAVYGLFPQEGDGEIVAREIASGKEHRIPAGQRPIDPPPSSEEPGEGPPPQRVPRIAISADSRTVAAETYPPKAEQDKARGRRPEQQPRNGLAILDLPTGTITRVENVRSFQFPEDAGGWIAYQKEPAGRSGGGEGGDAGGGPVRGAAARRGPVPSDVVVRNLSTGAERTLPAVLEYDFAKDGKRLAYLDENGAWVLDPAAADAPRALASGKAKYSKLTWNRESSRAAFYRDGAIYVWDGGAERAAEAVPASPAGLPPGFVPSDNGALSFSRDGSRLFFGAAPKRAEAEAKPDPGAAPQAVFDLWHWQDDFAKTIQKARAARERNRTYRAVLHLAGNKVTGLADLTLPEVTPAGDGRYAVGFDDRAYRPLVEYDTSYSDAYIVDTETGARTLFQRKLRGGGGGGAGFGGSPVQWSPTGRHAVFFDGKDWNAVSAVSGAVTNLTAKLGVNFYNELSDVPAAPGSYGSGGWSRDGRWVLLNDRHDVWQIAPDGSQAINLTDGEGRRQNLQFRAVRLDTDPDEPGIDTSKPLLLRAENLKTRDSGFFRDLINGSGAPQRLLMGAANYSNPSKAKGANVYLLTVSTFSEFPDLRVTDDTFRDLRKISDANPQQKGLLWGKSELIEFKNTDGVALQGILIKPENFDPKKKYPLMVYIYERLSDGLHTFSAPRPGHSVLPSFYASRGYLVLMPDIVYTTGYPGQSAMKCVLPAIQRVVDGGFVDENAIGIQGHSWGGYQISYMVTQTSRFRAAAAGAPVGNMTSAYNGIRYGPGLPRQFQYEKAQSRIGGSLWQYPERFLENSPVFMADRIRTPLLLLHNDNDDAVPFTQGIELFLSLRRLGKEAYLFNYNGEPHGLRKRANQKDYTERLQQFFDHYLKGEARPAWMERPGMPLE